MPHCDGFKTIQYKHYTDIHTVSGEEEYEFVAIRTQNRNHIRREREREINQNYAKSHLTALPKFCLRKSQAEDPKKQHTQKKKKKVN